MVIILRGFWNGSIIANNQPVPHRSKQTQSKTLHPQPIFTINQIQELSGMVFASPKESWPQRQHIIRSTTGSIDIWMYDITYNRAKFELVKLLEQHIPMRVILEDKKYRSFGNSAVGSKLLLEHAGARVLSDGALGLGTNFVHAKTFVTPHRVLMQTANLTKGGFGTSREHYIYLTDPHIVEDMKRLFNADRSGKPLNKDTLHPNIVVCPLNCRGIIEGMISGARESIIIHNQYIQDPRIQQLLSTKQKSGITIQAIVANNEFTGHISKLLGTGSVSIVRSPYPHTKLLLIDERYLMISSINLSTNSMDNNRELGIIVTNPDAITYVKQTFADDQHKAIKQKSSTRAGSTK